MRAYLHISGLCSTTAGHILSHRCRHDQIERQLESGNGERRSKRSGCTPHVCTHEFHPLFR